jgi:hypothetical protein
MLQHNAKITRLVDFVMLKHNLLAYLTFKKCSKIFVPQSVKKLSG